MPVDFTEEAPANIDFEEEPVLNPAPRLVSPTSVPPPMTGFASFPDPGALEATANKPLLQVPTGPIESLMKVVPGWPQALRFLPKEKQEAARKGIAKSVAGGLSSVTSPGGANLALLSAVQPEIGLPILIGMGELGIKEGIDKLDQAKNTEEKAEAIADIAQAAGMVVGPAMGAKAGAKVERPAVAPIPRPPLPPPPLGPEAPKVVLVPKAPKPKVTVEDYFEPEPTETVVKAEELQAKEQPAAPAAQPKEAYAPETRIEQESREPEHPGVAQRPAVSTDQPEVRQVEGGQAGGGNRPVGEPKKEGEVLLTKSPVAEPAGEPSTGGVEKVLSGTWEGMWKASEPEREPVYFQTKQEAIDHLKVREMEKAPPVEPNSGVTEPELVKSGTWEGMWEVRRDGEPHRFHTKEEAKAYANQYKEPPAPKPKEAWQELTDRLGVVERRLAGKLSKSERPLFEQERQSILQELYSIGKLPEGHKVDQFGNVQPTPAPPAQPTTPAEGKAWDAFTEKHFKEWADKTLHADERDAVESGIRRFTAEHPEILEKWSWPDIRRVAEREGFIKPYTTPAEGVGKGVPFTRDEIRVGKPSTSRRTRANGVDGEVRVEVDSPLKVTDPEIWSQIPDTSKLHAVIEGRLEFSTGKAPKKTEPKWSVWSGSKAKPELIAKDLTYQQAIERAKDHVESALTQPPPAATKGGGKPEIVGMGGAVPAEFARTGSPTANKNAVIDAEAIRRGEQPLLKPLRFSNQQAFDEAMGRIDRDPGLPDRLIQELNHKPRVIDPVEHMVLLRHRVDLRYEYHKAAREAAQAFDDGREADRIADTIRTNEWSDKLAELDKAVGRGGAGTEAGRALQVRRAMMNEDYSLATLELQKRADNGFRPLTDAERAELVKVANDYKAKADALEAHLATKQARISELEAARELDRIKAQAARLPYDKRVLDFAESVVVKMETAADAAAIRLRERLARMSVGVDPTIIADAAIIGSAKIARLGLDLAKFTDAMVKDFSEKIRPMIPQIWEASNKLLEQNLKETAPKVRTVIKHKMGLADFKNATERQIEERIQKGKRNELTPLIQKYARILVEQGITERNALIDAVHDFVNRLDPTMTRRNTMDAISGYGDFSQLRKDEISVKLRDLKGQMQQVAKLEDMQAGKPPIKTGLERRIPTAEESRLIKLVNDAKREFQIPITDPNTQLKSSLDTLKARMRSRIAELEGKLQRGEFDKRPRRPITLDDTATRLKADLGRVTKDWERAREADRLAHRKPWQRRLDAFVRWERNFKLSSPVVFGKLGAAALTRAVTTTTEEIIGGAVSRVLPTLAERAPREGGGFNAKYMAKALTAAISKGMDDASKTAKTGASDIDIAYGDKLVDKDWANFFGRIHGMVKAPVKRAEFELSLQKRIEHAIRNGLDPSDPMVMQRLSSEALDDGYRSIFMQHGFSGDMFNQFVNQLEKSKKYPLGGEITARMARFLMPVVRVPLNIVGETATGAHGLFTASARTLWHATHEGLANVDPKVADSIMRQFKKGSIGLGLMAIGFLNPENVGGYDYREKRGPEDPKVSGFRIFGLNIPRWMTHAPWFELMQMGATIRRTMDRHVDKTGENATGLAIGTKAAALGLIEETPFVGTMLRADKMFQSQAEWDRYWGEMAKGTLIPQAIQWSAKQIDKSVPFVGEETERKPKTFTEHVMMGLPGLRQSVPEKPMK